MILNGDCSLHYQCILKDVNGKIIHKKTDKAHSFTKAFIQMLYGFFSPVGDDNTNFSIIDTGNTARTIGERDYGFFMGAGSGTTTYGLQVGSATTAVTIDDYKLDTLIAHGTSSGQLQYSAVSFGAPATTSTTTTMRVTRVFTNGSGGNVVVREAGIGIQQSVGGFTRFFLLIRDVLGTPITVTNGQQLTINYTIKTTI